MLDAAFRVLPFRFLDQADRDWLGPRLTPASYPAGSTILRQGDRDDRRVFLLLEGTVDIRVPHKPGRVTRIQAGHYFGERAALFDMPRAFDAVALTNARCACVAGDDLLELLRRSPVFAQQLGWSLRDKQGLFLPFERFRAELVAGAARGHLVIPRLLHLYRPLGPALHTQVNDPALDLEALTYAVHRLPRNLTRTLSWFLTDDLPRAYRCPDNLFPSIPTAARRRAVWELMPGKNLVLLRDGQSDLADLVTCLCIYAVEARKIRHRLRDPEALQALAAGDLTQLPFEPHERAALERLWPDLRAELLAVAAHHEDHAVSVYKSLDNYNSAHAERWTRQLADAVTDLLGVEPHELPADFPVRIVSSNTHSVTNVLSTWLPAREAAITAWGAQHAPELFDLPWPDPFDRLVALARPYLAAHPHEAAERARMEREAGVRHLRETALTGIEVQLIDLRGEGLLVNIDYAFGQQAEGIIGSLIALFGPRIRGIDVLGKAGGLVGARGDVLVATGFVEQDDDTLHVPTVSVDVESLARRLPDRRVHVGPVLTVLGTVLQNRPMLGYYRNIWGCVGLEMEGTYYCRQILESQRRGALREDLALRFLYYVSDLPLQAGATLSGPLRPHEGIPPLYAITREILADLPGL